MSYASKRKREQYPVTDDNRECGRPTKSGRPCRAHALLDGRGLHIGCYLHDPRRAKRANPKASDERL
jgi:hypothetical protein